MVQPLKIHQRHLLKSKDIKKLIQTLQTQLGLNPEILHTILNPKDRVEWIKLDDNQELYVINGILTFWHREGKFIPLLSFLTKHDLPYPRVKVDQGAVKFMSKGADVMRPGIIEIDAGIRPGDIVLIEDPQHGRILSVGEALYSSESMETMDSGKVIKCIHSLSDPIWNFSKSYK
ncbi:MAG: RNA-binding protein [Candidatus Lokiarchaeota archaeon]|nr:RNA-binding protein [Candidatus Harpocratesius repetitus]